jgi:hypothetical protein
MTQIPFDDLIDRFKDGVANEAAASNIATPPIPGAAVTFLRSRYEARHTARDPSPATSILECAEVLGMIAFAMFRADLPANVGDPTIPHAPHDPRIGPPPTEIEVRHVRAARDLYGFYTNSELNPQMVNPLRAPFPINAFTQREIDMPCPLCP